MLAKLSIDQAIMKAKFHLKKNEKIEAKKIYQIILQSFPKNLRVQQELATLNKTSQNNVSEGLPQVAIDQLVHLYNQGKFSVVVEQAQEITNQYPDTIMVWNILGASLAEIGMLDEAMKAYKKAISLKPDYAEVYSNMGNVFINQAKLDKAIDACNKAISIKPDYAEAYSNMGNALQNKGELDKAIDACNKAILLKPDYAEAYSNMGNALQNKGKLDKAIEMYNQALSLKPYLSVVYNNLGNALKGQGKLDKAIEVYNKALVFKPDYAEAYGNMGISYNDQGKFDKAIESYKMAISLKPDYAEAYFNMGNVLQGQGELDEAIEVFNKALLLNPYLAEIYNNLGNALKDLGKIDEAIEVYNKALALEPNYAQAYNNMGIALKDKGMLEGAIDWINKSILLKPEDAEVHQNLSFVLLNSGKLKEGFDEYEWRWKSTKFLPQRRFFSKPIWDGRSLNGKRILLWSEQGIGDTINWSSCLSLISSQAAHCILECQDKLVPLLERSFPKVEVKAENRSLDLERDDFDFHLPMGSIYKYFIQEISEKASVDAFLVPDPVRVNYWKKRLHSLGKGPYIGISWKSFNMSLSRLPNYAHISEWSPILTIPNVTFINLQYKDFEDDLAKIKNELGITIHNFDDLDHFNNLTEVAALSAALDVVVSIKNTVPIISAGVGTLTKLANWRQSSWSNVLFNPTSSAVDILEKNTWEPWNDVFSQIADDIFKLKN